MVNEMVVLLASESSAFAIRLVHSNTKYNVNWMSNINMKETAKHEESKLYSIHSTDAPN